MTRKITDLMKITPEIEYVESLGVGDPNLQRANIRPLLDMGYRFKYDGDKGLRNTVNWVLRN